MKSNHERTEHQPNFYEFLPTVVDKAEIWALYTRAADAFALSQTSEGNIRPIWTGTCELAAAMLDMIPERPTPREVCGELSQLSDEDLITRFCGVEKHRGRGISERDTELMQEYLRGRGLGIGWFWHASSALHHLGVPEHVAQMVFDAAFRRTAVREWIIYALMQVDRTHRLCLHVSGYEVAAVIGCSKSTFWEAVSDLEERGLIVRGKTFKNAPGDADEACYRAKNYYVLGPRLRQLLDCTDEQAHRRVNGARLHRRAKLLRLRQRQEAKRAGLEDPTLLDFMPIEEWMQAVAAAVGDRETLRGLMDHRDLVRSNQVAQAIQEIMAGKASFEAGLETREAQITDDREAAITGAEKANASMLAIIEPEPRINLVIAQIAAEPPTEDEFRSSAGIVEIIGSPDETIVLKEYDVRQSDCSPNGERPEIKRSVDRALPAGQATGLPIETELDPRSIPDPQMLALVTDVAKSSRSPESAADHRLEAQKEVRRVGRPVFRDGTIIRQPRRPVGQTYPIDAQVRRDCEAEDTESNRRVSTMLEQFTKKLGTSDRTPFFLAKNPGPAGR